MSRHRSRDIFISLFVIVWLAVFHYESVRAFYLQPMLQRSLPKVPWLFPPAGWIMFFKVDEGYGHAEVYGILDGQLQPIDPHLILPVRDIGYDNVHRNVLIEILNPRDRSQVCGYLERRLPEFEGFVVTAVDYPALIRRPYKRYQSVMYQCP